MDLVHWADPFYIHTPVEEFGIFSEGVCIQDGLPYRILQHDICALDVLD